MARLIVWNVMTADGYFEGDKKWDLDFHSTVWGPELEKLSLEFGEKAEALIFGRVTYEGMRDYWTTTTAEEGAIKHYMNALPKVAVSRTLGEANWNNTRIASDIGEIAHLKNTAKKDLYVFGSADLVHSLLEADLVDELMICIAPVLLGSGTPLFKQGKRRALKLEDVRPLANGAMIVRYLPN